MKSDDATKQWFRDMPDEKKRRLHAMMTELFPKLEAEWRANPDNQGKPFSYVIMWEEFIARQSTARMHHKAKDEKETDIWGYWQERLNDKQAIRRGRYSMTDYDFKVGDRHENRKGPYEVISVSGQSMTIRWDTGEEVQTDMKGQAKVLANMQRELQASSSKSHRGPDWYGEQFTGLQDHDFNQDVTGTRWRSREMFGGLVARNIAAGDLDFNSWAIYGSPIVHWADIKRYRRKDAHYQAKMLGMAREDGFCAGFVVERSENPAESREDWNSFVAWLSTEENALRQVVEQYQLSVYDPYRTWDGVFKGVITATNGLWYYQAEQGEAPVALPSIHKVLSNIGNDTWLDLFIVKKYTKEEAVARGRNLGVEIGEMLSALVPVYMASTSAG